MIDRCRSRAGGLLALLALLCLFVPPVEVRSLAQDQDPEKAKKIAEVEKQIAELNKKLGELQTKNTSDDKKTEAAAIAGLPESYAKALHWRPIGPANMAGRITSMAVFEADPSTYWIATASGGLLKTVNNGVTFVHQFDKEATVSIGDVAVAPSDREIVWVGIG